MPEICFPVNPPFSPFRLASDYRDFYGDLHAKLTELTDPILDAACYVPRFFHAPDQQDEDTGVAANGYLEYALTIPPGSFILGFLHSYTSAPSANTTDAPVTSSFRFQVTDVKRNYKFSVKPLPETWLLNDQPSSNPQSPIAGGPGGGLYILNPSCRLLMAPYPVAPPGMFKVEFWNTATDDTGPIVNTNCRLTMLTAVPGE